MQIVTSEPIQNRRLHGQSVAEFSVSDALGMYQRLRQRGQNSTLARLSVEAHCSELSPEQRGRVRQLLRAQDSSVA